MTNFNFNELYTSPKIEVYDVELEESVLTGIGSYGNGGEF